MAERASAIVQTMATPTRPQAAFGTRRTNIAGVLTRAQAMHDAMGAGGAQFAGAPVALPDFLVLIEGLRLATVWLAGVGIARNRIEGIWIAGRGARGRQEWPGRHRGQ